METTYSDHKEMLHNDPSHSCNYCVIARTQQPHREDWTPQNASSELEVSQRLELLEQQIYRVTERLSILEHFKIISPPPSKPVEPSIRSYDQTQSSADNAEALSEGGSVSQTSLRKASPLITSNLPFGIQSSNVDVMQPGMAAERLQAMWQQYLSSVDPLLKLVDASAVRRLFREGSEVKSEDEPLRLAICFAAATSIRPTIRESTASSESATLLGNYAKAFEESLSKAQFLREPTIAALQSITIYLTCGRKYLGSTYVWSLTALLVRLATKLSLHLDPESLKVSFEERESRRRLWWHICALDAATAEANGTDPLIYERQCTTRLPSAFPESPYIHPASASLESLSISSNGAKESPDLFYSLLRFEITYYARTVLFSDVFTEDNGFPVLSAEGKVSIIDSLEKTLEDKYFRRYDCDSAVCKMAIVSSKVVIAGLKLKIFRQSQTDQPLSRSEAEQTLQAGVEVLEGVRALRADPTSSRWNWLWQDYPEWDAVHVCLPVLGNNGYWLTSTSRAWSAIDSFFDAYGESGRDPANEHRWRRLKSLRARVKTRQALNAYPSQDGQRRQFQPLVSTACSMQEPGDRSNSTHCGPTSSILLRKTTEQRPGSAIVSSDVLASLPVDEFNMNILEFML